MRKHLLCAAALGLSAIATPAAAQDSESILIQTGVPKYCQGSLASMSSSLTLDDITGPAGFVVSTFSGTTSTSTTTAYYCNAPAKVTLDVDPLVNPITVVDTASFVNRVDFRASLTWDNVTGSASSADANPTEIPSLEANTGIMTLAVSNPSVPSGDRPIAGAYTGAVTVTVAVQ